MQKESVYNLGGLGANGQGVPNSLCRQSESGEASQVQLQTTNRNEPKVF